MKLNLPALSSHQLAKHLLTFVDMPIAYRWTEREHAQGADDVKEMISFVTNAIPAFPKDKTKPTVMVICSNDH